MECIDSFCFKGVYMFEGFFVLSVLSFIANAFLAYKLYKKKHILNVDAQRLLSNILSGSTVVKIDVIDPSGLFYRSPRG